MRDRRTRGVAWLVAVTTLAARVAIADQCTQQCKADTTTCVANRCAGLHGQARRDCLEICRGIGGCAAIRTLAYVVTECRTDANGSAIRQALKIRRGNCAPITVMELPFGPPVPEGIGLCRLYGDAAAGVASVLAAPFQRLTVSANAADVVFEVTNASHFPLIPLLLTAPSELEGLYYVRSDGSGLRRLGEASRYPRWQVVRAPNGPLLGLQPYVNAHAGLSPSSRRLAYSDLGPGPSGEQAPQVWILDIATGARHPITRLRAPAVAGEGFGATDLLEVAFVDERTVTFSGYEELPDEPPSPVRTYRSFLVQTDGSGIRVVPTVEAVPGAKIDPTFGIVGTGPATPGVVSFPDGTGELVLYHKDGKVLQLTKFGSPDMRAEAITPNGRRIFFITPADPLGTNPSHNCQLFSINDFAGGLRQLTPFHEVDQAESGCNFTLPRSGCGLSTTFADPVTGTIVFYSNCDPFGTTPQGGQLFAISPDGSHLRQLTATRGLTVDDDGTVTTELPGPFWYSSNE